MPAVMNAANEQAVSLFLQNKIRFNNIAELILNALDNVSVGNNTGLEAIIETDLITRKYVNNIVKA